MTDQLDRSTLLGLLKLRGELSEIGHTRVDVALEHLHQQLGRLLHTDYSLLIVHSFSPQLADEQPETLSPSIETTLLEAYGTDATQRTRIGRDWSESTPDVYDDPIVRMTAEGLGTRRTFRQVEDASCHRWRNSAVPDLWYATGMRSRLLTMVPIDESVEVTFGLDRPRSERPFTERDRQFLDLAFAHLTPLLRSFCQRRGLLPDQTSLTPRERDVLEFLLGPLSEKEIAHELGLSTSWLHEVVISIYRKFNVRSRAELMSQWL
ncbi:helix-turn-helix transcriptional regulator [Persicimonas caeni]|uniref:Helix-turn-helix transcriptional regulator n=1 Tax=Persicimonas caeni TaxID=2292766 RepID=A0A4Y6PV05_PERCE|nr:LuxR C-terminal-related transcriptional regulator [Persicimonas caeni]QDG51827.1 helix-turn-helix transcriptional regulator [Persicimonas caeni]QED33048.1 helix-turn-helix transcriptional regulator [Persicimonas caeni]